jgi:xylitol oxidase
VFEHLDWDTLLSSYDAIAASGYSVGVFTLWGETSSVWVKSRGEGSGELLGRPAASVDRHPIPGIDPVNATAQRGVPGPWWDRLPHFRMGFTPSAGEELQSEFLIPRRHALAAIDAVRALAPRVRPLLQVGEIRTIAADALWMSPQYGQPTTGIHFTWKREPGAVEAVLAEVESALAPFEARPHWGKLFLASPGHLYERRDDFVRLAERLDPRGAFRNAWLERVLLDAGAP